MPFTPAQLDLRHGFISALIATAQNGHARDVDPFAGLCRETWGEEALFDALKDLPHGRHLRTRLMHASMAGSVARVEWLLKRGARLELMDAHGATALNFAASGQLASGRLGAARALLRAGAQVGGGSGAMPPLLFASQAGHLALVELLLAHGADTEASWEARDGRAALVFACRGGGGPDVMQLGVRVGLGLGSGLGLGLGLGLG